jgi:D-cysteine desulfhydrase family pyridoxal phosphate-dependent enzyme
MKDVVEHLKKKIDNFPRIPISLIPTPCHRLNYISEKYGVDVFCKRDDLTGFGFGGNKSRKLEFLIAEALDHDCDTILTTGGIQSNFCRITAAAGAHAGLSVHLLLGGKKPENLTGNLILNQLLGAKLHYIETDDWDEWEKRSQVLTNELESNGHRVFHIPIGGSVPTGALAYILAFLELLEDEERMNISFDHIIHASGSAGTQAGLVAGKSLTGWKGWIHGISVGMDRKSLTDTVAELANKTAQLVGGNVNPEEVDVDDSHIGEGYAIPTKPGQEAIELFAKKEGIFLDHVYTGKAAAALLAWLEKDRFKGEKVLFLHTGGTPELFA